MMNKKEVFTLNEIGIKKIKNGILLLDTSYFEILYLTLSSSIDEREREYEIEERIREKIKDYDDFEFIEKEIIIDQSDIISFSILILLKKDTLDEILSLVKKEKIELYGIYPLCLTEIFNPYSSNGIYLEITENDIKEFYFENRKLVKFNSIQVPIKDFFDNPNILYEETFKKENQEFFTYSHNDFIKEVLPELKISIFDKEKLKFNTALNFLPDEDLKKILHKKITKYLVLTFSIFLILFIFFNLFLNSQNAKLYSKINQLEIKLRNLNSEKEQLLTQIENCEENIEEFTNNVEFSKPIYNLSNTTLNIFSLARQLEIIKFEYDGIDKFVITGRGSKEEDVSKFLTALKNIKNIKFSNHDFIEYKNNYYNFKIEVEVLD